MNTTEIYTEGALWLLDDYSEPIYICGEKDHLIRYMNKACRELFGFSAEEDLTKLRCHEAVNGTASPCSFCTVREPDENRYFIWEYYNDYIKKQLVVRDRIVSWKGERCRMQVAAVAESKEQLQSLLSSKINIVNLLPDCIETLVDMKNVNVSSAGLEAMLEVTARFYQADRAYALELNKDPKASRLLAQWNNNGMIPVTEQDGLLGLTAEESGSLRFSGKKPLILRNLEEIREEAPKEYGRLKARGVHSLFVVPYIENGEAAGYIALDNPCVDMENFSMLKTLSFFVANQIGRNRLQEQLKRSLFFDALTGLPNRNSYNEYISGLSAQSSEPVGFAVVNINALGQINRDFGSSYGDSMIKTTAEVLEKHFREASVFRMDGDEFVIVYPGISYSDFSEKVDDAEELLCGKTVSGCATGTAWAAGEGSPPSLILPATKHMTERKRRYYDSHGGNLKYNSLQILQNLKKALAERRYQIRLQPKLAMNGQTVSGAEALVRYVDAAGNIVPPDQFIPLFEKEGLISHIDFFVLEEVCRLLSGWIAEGKKVIQISVNFSRLTLLENGMLKRVLEIVDRYKVPHEYIWIEGTETAGGTEQDALVSKGCLLLEKGFGVSLDDFCSEYSCVSLLSALPFSEVKFDRSMIAGLAEKEPSRIICKSMMELCSKLGLSVLAEGVETEEQLEILKSYNCSAVQGYLFASPMTVEQFEDKYLS